MSELLPPDTKAGNQALQRQPARPPGYNRGERCVIDAVDDESAIAQWVKEKSRASQQTGASYRKEADRLKLWLYYINKQLADVTRNDFEGLERLLEAPPPELVMKRRYRRNDRRWRPFTGPLRPSSRYQSMIIMRSCLQYLVEVGYLAANPMPAPIRPPLKWAPTARSLPPEARQLLLEAIDQETDAPDKLVRLKAMIKRWNIMVLYRLGARASEQTKLRMGDVQKVLLKGRYVWQIAFVGKGNKPAELPMTPFMMGLLADLRYELGMPTWPQEHESFPLCPSLRGLTENGYRQPPTPANRTTVYRQTKNMMANARDMAQARGNAEAAAILAKASPHWLRHTILREMADNNVDHRLIRAQGRHASFETTQRYITPEKADLYDAMLNQDALADAPQNNEAVIKGASDDFGE